MADRNTINLGDHARDRLTGFEGIVVGITEWLNACRHIGIKPRNLDKDGQPQEAKWFDEPQVDLVQAGVFPNVAIDPRTGDRTGGPTPSGLR